MIIRGIVLGFLGLALVGQSALAQTPASTSCAQTLKTLSDQWQSMGYLAPAKPMQFAVAGSNGQTMSAAEIRRVNAQFRSAQSDCSAGRDAAAMQRASTIRSLMGSSEG